MCRDLVAEAAADVLRDEAELVDARAHRRAHHDRGETGELVVRVDRPLTDAAVELDERAVGLERRRVEAVEVQLVDLHDLVGLRECRVEIAPLVHAAPHEVAPGVFVQDGLRVVERVTCVGDGFERLVLDFDELRCVARQLARLGDHGDDRLADVAHLADGERVILDVPARHRRDLEERIGERRDFFARERPEDALHRLRLRNVDRRDVGVRVRRADEVDVAHSVALDVVDEDALALDEPLVFLARHVLALVRRLGRLDLDLLGSDRRRAPHHGRHGRVRSAAVATASTMFQYPVQRQMLPCRPFLISASVGRAFVRSSAVALISIPGVQ